MIFWICGLAGLAAKEKIMNHPEAKELGQARNPYHRPWRKRNQPPVYRKEDREELATTSKFIKLNIYLKLFILKKSIKNRNKSFSNPLGSAE